MDVALHFMKEANVMHHNKGFWNVNLPDMYTETTFVMSSHRKRGLIGIILKAETMKTWASTLHLCTQLQADISEMWCTASVTT